jgi:DNA-binding response OmpR family regulator
MRILIVDDEKSIRDLLCQLCTREGHAVVTAESVPDALAHLKAGDFELLITDIVMPQIDGLALVRRARALQPEIVAIVITGHAGRYSYEDVIEAGAADLLLKPFRAAELRARLKLAEETRKRTSC